MALRKIELMHWAFGRTEGRCCRECSNFVKGRYHDRILRKCSVYGLTHSEASDWAGRYAACGMFDREYTGRPLIEAVKRSGGALKPPTEPLDGQYSICEV